MKTSFYFVIWIVIYPLLNLLHNRWIDENSFIVAIFVVWILSRVINRSIPHIIGYERLIEVSRLLENVYSGNVGAIRKQLSRQTTIEFITAIYFGTTFVFILSTMFANSVADDWFSLLIFGFFAFATITRAVQINKILSSLKADPTPERCRDIVESYYKLDYTDYYNRRVMTSAEGVLPPAPPRFKIFQIFSLIVAIICSILGLVYLVISIVVIAEGRSGAVLSGGIMYFLYGSLAAYFGLRDTFTIISYLKSPLRSAT